MTTTLSTISCASRGTTTDGVPLGPCPSFPQAGSNAVVAELRRLAREPGVKLCTEAGECVPVAGEAWDDWRRRLGLHAQALRLLAGCV